MRACAVCNLAQIERWQPSTDRDRRAKAVNIAQAQAYIDEHGSSHQCKAVLDG